MVQADFWDSKNENRGMPKIKAGREKGEPHSRGQPQAGYHKGPQGPAGGSWEETHQPSPLPSNFPKKMEVREAPQHRPDERSGSHYGFCW